MLRTRRDAARVLALAFLLMAPAAWAQQSSGIAGIVRDTSGGVLPGVTVEAASPALIERVRTVVTDTEGRYNLADMRPGAYIVTFILPGFSTFKREGIVLTAGFTATVNVDMQVGSLEETITVTGASPLVDTQNVRKQLVVSSDLLDALPTGSKALGTLITLTPGLTGVADVGGSMGAYRAQGTPQSVQFHGRTGMKVNFDGMGILNMVGDGNTGYIMNALVVQEMVLESGGVSADSAASGFAANGIPREGGNAFSFSFSGVYSTERLQSDNLSDELIKRGVNTVDKVLRIYDAGVTLGGPVKKDKLWFLAAYRNWGNENQIAGIYWNKTQGTPFYTPDRTRPADRFEYFRSWAGRLTWQASSKNKISFFADTQNNCSCRREGFIAPEAQASLRFKPQGLYQVTWNSPVTNKLLLEGGAGATISHWPTILPQAGVRPTDISIVELSTGFRYNSAASYNKPQDSDRYAQRASVSYVTGSHAFKGGFQLEQGVSNVGITRNGDIDYGLLKTVPNRITQFATPYLEKLRIKADLGLYLQDQWRIRRLTLNYGMRFDYFNGHVPAQDIPATRFVPARSFAEVTNVPLWKDINPRVGGSYDLHGDGRTAIKASLGRYVSKTGITTQRANNPITTSVNQVNRTWNDANGNYLPDCDLNNPAANGECGPVSDLNFGKVKITTRYDDDVLLGFGARESNWDVTTEFQHQLTSGISVNGGYYRNWSGHFQVTNNLATAPTDFSPFCITAPTDPRLPGGGGYPVCGLYDVSVAKFGAVNNLVTHASKFGNQTRVSNFFSLGINTRLRSGLRLGGGFDTGRTVTDNCFVINSPQQLLNCHQTFGFSPQAQVKLFGSYPLPKDFIVSGTFQNVGGLPYEANYAVANAAIAPSLGRNLSSCGTRPTCNATVSVPLITPFAQFEKRRTQLDVRLTKYVRLTKKLGLQANFDVYNAFNASSLLGVNNTYGSQWRVPASSVATGAGVLNGRLVQFSGKLSF
jgi:hypothetical protein